MSASLYAEVLIQGFLTGLVYGLMALGLSVIFGIVRVVNFAHGEFAVLAMYASFLLFGVFHVDPLLAALPVGALFFVVGYAFQRAVVQPFVRRPQHEQFILLVGLALVIVNALLILFGPDAQHIGIAWSYDSFEIGSKNASMFIDKTRVYAGLGALILTGALFAFFRFTLAGVAIRACADNPTGAGVVGLDVKRIYATTFGLGLACTGAAGAIMTVLFDMSPALGPSLTLLAFTIVIVGGLGSMAGALAGGVLIGVVEALASVVIAPSMKSLVSFALLVIVLAVRPQGLLGRAA